MEQTVVLAALTMSLAALFVGFLQLNIRLQNLYKRVWSQDRQLKQHLRHISYLEATEKKPCNSSESEIQTTKQDHLKIEQLFPSTTLTEWKSDKLVEQQEILSSLNTYGLKDSENHNTCTTTTTPLEPYWVQIVYSW